jgi:hypothetical protein
MLNAKQRVALFALLLAGALAYGFQFGIGGGQNTGTLAPEVQKRGPAVRSVTGVVLDQSDNPVARAVVYLKNTKTLNVKTSITTDTGKYQFSGLAPNQDYELYAGLNGSKSPTRTLSAFDSREKATLNLHIDQSQKNEQKADQKTEQNRKTDESQKTDDQKK